MKMREERRKELKDGRKNYVIAEMFGVSFQHVSNIFLGRCECPKTLALLLISLKERIPVDDRTMPEWLKYYFYEEE